MTKWIEWRGQGIRILTPADDDAITAERRWLQPGEVIQVSNAEAEYYATDPSGDFIVHDSDPSPQRERASRREAEADQEPPQA